MELFVPFMLFLLQVGETDSAQFELSRHPALFETVEDCRAEGERLKSESAAETGDVLEVYCFAMPDPDEFEELIEAIQDRRAQAREAKP